jgi:hypothetical protein
LQHTIFNHSYAGFHWTEINEYFFVHVEGISFSLSHFKRPANAT